MCKMNILCVGDPHIKVDNLHMIDLLEQQLLAVIQTHAPNFVVLLGDLLHHHEKLYTLALNRAYTFIDRVRQLVPVYILVGNHDYISNQIFLGTDHWMNSLKQWKNVTIVDHVLREGDCVFLPFVPPGRFIEALETLPDWKTARYIFAHQEFYGCSMNAITSNEGDKWDLSFPQVVSGHIHDRQTVQANIYYTGSSLQHSFGETSKKSLLLIQNTKFVELYLDFPRKRSIQCTLHELELNENEYDEHTRFVVRGQFEEFKLFQKSARYRDLVKNGSKVVFKPEESITVVETETDFAVALSDAMMSKRDEVLYSVFQKVVYDKDVDEESILLI
jgi:DNA repair exonuclease SbcCD nuclease subunit